MGIFRKMFGKRPAAGTDLTKGEMVSGFGSASPVRESASAINSKDAFHRAERFLLALVGGCLAAYFEQYLPPLLLLPALAVGGLVALFAWISNFDEEHDFPLFLKPLAVFVSVQILWLAVSQPLYGFVAPVLVSFALSVVIVRISATFLRRKREDDLGAVSVSGVWRYLLAVPMSAALSWPLEKAYMWAFSSAVPELQSARVALYTVSPFLLVLVFMGVTAYCAWRIKEGDERIVHNFLPGLTAALFAVVFPMYEPDGSGWWAFATWGNAAEWLFVVIMLILGLAGSRRLLLLIGNGLGTVFCALFVLFTAVPELHQFMIAASMNVRQPERLPLSTDTPRIMPYGIGEKRCLEGNAESATHAGGVSYTLESNGINYQCALHFDGFVAGEGWMRGLISMIPGATYKIVRVGSTNTSGQITPVEAIFPFGESNSILKSAVLARHPGGKLADFTYTEENGKIHLVYSYTSSRLFWFTMVPSVGGAVVETQSGLLQDLTVSQAAERFGGAFLVPAELVRAKAEAWAHYRLFAWWPFRQEKELSEPGDTLAGLPAEQRKLFGDNKLPFAISTQAGPKYWLLLEPAGSHGTAGSEVMLFDARYPGLIEMKDTTKGRAFKGLRNVVTQAPAVVPGNFNLRGSEVYLHITEKDMYLIVPLLDTNGKFIGTAVLRSDESIVFAGAVSTAQEVVDHISEFEQLN
ncbi:MAG: hypothetical protein C0469_00020 [Cyanobacteria bacterium DS2.3.42]|nr:hypothetical protein [Cyanobacteria bacterium DS2.3.42]